jgi:hypothetical protein
MALTALATRRRHDAWLAWHAIFIPVYWLMISLAAYRALIDLVRAPFHWRKTMHLGRRGGEAEALRGHGAARADDGLD